MSALSLVKSTVDTLQFEMSKAAAQHEAKLRPLSEQTSISHKGYIRAAYLSAFAFCVGIFPLIYTPEPGFMHSFSLALMGFSWVLFVACIVYMVIYRVGVDNGWIAEKGMALVAQPVEVAEPTPVAIGDFAFSLSTDASRV